MAQEGLDAKRARMAAVLGLLKREYPEARCSLDFGSPFQLLCATILSAQCTDERVNLVTPALFARFPDARAMAEAPLPELEALVKTTGFFRNKARALKEMAQAVLDAHGGELPRDLEALTALRGVGRKTANVLLGVAFGIPSGVVVDTHVGRISRRLGFTRELDPVKVERALGEIVPREDWILYSHLLIDHGRAVCTARVARCDRCALTKFCPKRGV